MIGKLSIYFHDSRTKILLLSFFLFMELISCSQMTPPPQPVLSIPLPPETTPVTEPALTPRIVVDIPPPVSVQPPMKPVIQVLPPEAWKIVVKKRERKLLLFQHGELVKWYPVDLGEIPTGPKVCQGDKKTPEGEYRIIQKKDGGQTKYYRAFLLDYPNETDRIRYNRAVENGYLPKDKGIGGLIEIHGEGKGVDWTQGCMALINSHMEELFNQIPVGTSVRIDP